MEQPKRDGMAALDLLITTLMEHEKNLDAQITKLETIAKSLLNAEWKKSGESLKGLPRKQKKMGKKVTNGIRRLIDIGSGMLLTSGLLDLWLWFREGTMVPSWTITAISIAALALLQVVRVKTT